MQICKQVWHQLLLLLIAAAAACFHSAFYYTHKHTHTCLHACTHTDASTHSHTPFGSYTEKHRCRNRAVRWCASPTMTWAWSLQPRAEGKKWLLKVDPWPRHAPWLACLCANEHMNAHTQSVNVILRSQESIKHQNHLSKRREPHVAKMTQIVVCLSHLAHSFSEPEASLSMR